MLLWACKASSTVSQNVPAGRPVTLTIKPPLNSSRVYVFAS